VGSSSDPVPVPVAVALGSNLGDRESHLRQALSALSLCIDNLRVSRFYDTEPVGVVGEQGLFLNAAASGLTTRDAPALMRELLAIEAGMGRTRPFAGAARTIDLDLILYGDRIISTPTLTVPHPRFRDREFVLAPLADVAGDWVDPVSGRTVSECLRQVVAARGGDRPRPSST
jgi:2-amino-4-hydroxy-6-hydroxymethyldihydropteridine diphosphokinase